MAMQKLYHLLDEYALLDGDAAKAVEKRIWNDFGCDRAVLVLDMSGFSRLTRRFGIVHYLALVRRMQNTAGPLVAAHNGQVVKFEADNLFGAFASATDALQCARAIRQKFAELNEETADEKDVKVSIGMAWGRILVVDNGDYFGDAVNVACKLGEDLASASEILIDKSLRDLLPAELDGAYMEPLELTVSGLKLDAWTVRENPAAAGAAVKK